MRFWKENTGMDDENLHASLYICSRERPEDTGYAHSFLRWHAAADVGVKYLYHFLYDTGVVLAVGQERIKLPYRCRDNVESFLTIIDREERKEEVILEVKDNLSLLFFVRFFIWRC